MSNFKVFISHDFSEDVLIFGDLNFLCHLAIYILHFTSNLHLVLVLSFTIF